MLRSFRNLEKQIRYNQCGRKNLGITILQNVCKYSHFCSLVLDDMEFPDWTGMLYFCHSSFCLFYSVEATWELIKSYSWQTANSQKSTGLFKRFSIIFTCFQVILKSYCICFEQYWFSFLLIVCTEREALTCFASLLPCCITQVTIDGLVAQHISAHCFWQVVHYILTVEKDHDMDINDTDALWGETGISLLVCFLIRVANWRIKRF